VKSRELSQQPEAVRKRSYRDRIRQRHGLNVPTVPEVPLPSPPVPPVPASSVAAVSPSSNGHATVPPAPATTPPPAPPLVELLETEPVRGDGAAAYASPLAIGADEQGTGGVPLVEEPVVQAAPREPITPLEAKAVGKILGGYCKFGWRILAADHVEALAALIEPLLESHPELAKLSPDQKVAVAIEIMGSAVAEAGEECAGKYNIRIPYLNEGIVGVGVGTATLGVVKLFTRGRVKNENERVRDAKDANPPPTAPPRKVPDDVPDNAPDEEPARPFRASDRSAE
jgi:hypothetical protein